MQSPMYPNENAGSKEGSLLACRAYPSEVRYIRRACSSTSSDDYIVVAQLEMGMESEACEVQVY